MIKIWHITFFVVFNLVASNLFSQDEKITLTDIWASAKFIPEMSDHVTTLKDGEHYAILQNNRITKYSFKKNKSKVIADFSKETHPKLSIDNFSFSDNETSILVSTYTESIYRHSTKAHYWIYNVNDKSTSPIDTSEKIRLIDFIPNTNKIVFQRNNNLYIYDQSSNEITPITVDGISTKIINGAPDWVYEEEFSFSKGFECSPDGKMIAYMRFDESNVNEVSIPIYQSQYPEIYKFKYPRAGEENAKVTLHIYHIENKKTITINIEDNEEFYIPRIKWTNNSTHLSLLKLNRLQNNISLLLADPNSGKTETIIEEKNDKFINLHDNLVWLPNDEFIWTSEKDGWNHIYKYNLNGKEIKKITHGQWNVLEVFGQYDNTLYYSSTETSPLEKQIYSVNIDGSSKSKLTDKDGTHDVQFSNNFRYYIDIHSSANTPYKVEVRNNKGKLLRSVIDNELLLKRIDNHAFTKKEFFKLTLYDSVSVNGFIMKPTNFDPSKKHPLYMYVYGGPGHQTVTDDWGWFNYLYHQYLTQQGYVVISVDGRGTDNRGEEFSKCTFGELGKYESEDQIAVARYFSQQPYIDSTRIGIQGWSFGGTIAALCLFKAPNLFKMGIAIAPVTNWRFYDTIYSERYMGLPKDNADGYDLNSPVAYASNLKGKFLLVHGMADDNVHIQNSLSLTNALIDDYKDFDQIFYPNKNHGIYGGFTRLHLYTKVTNFIIENL